MNREDVERVVVLNNASNNTLHGFGENLGIRLVERHYQIKTRIGVIHKELNDFLILYKQGARRQRVENWRIAFKSSLSRRY